MCTCVVFIWGYLPSVASAMQVSFSTPPTSRNAVCACALALGLWATAHGQISVTDTTGWNAWTNKLTGGIITDAPSDQQTGQGQDDFVGNTTYAAFQQKAGQINGVDSIIFRARMDTYDTQHGFGGMLTLGLDLDGNGTLDLLVQADDKSQTKGVWFAQPGTGANDAPSTTTWGNFAGKITFNSSTYNYQQAGDGSTFNGTPDAFVTFAISFADLQNGIRTYAKGAFSNYTLTYASLISYIAFTTTQGNAINQDLLGVPKNYSTSTTYANLGALTPQISAWGQVPEPATYAQLGALLLAGGFVAWRRRSRAASRGDVS